MSGSDAAVRRELKMRRRKVLTIWRDDHIGDTIGRIFLDAGGQGEDGIIDCLRQYLGSKVKILKAELTRDCVTVEVESRGFSEESTQLAAAAHSLSLKGARRNAQSLFREALQIDPLNKDAMLGLGTLLVDLERYEEALPILKRAREVAGDRVELLQALGHVCHRLERIPRAIAYFELALELRPNDPTTRRALSALGWLPGQPSEEPPRRMRLVRKRRKS